MFNVKAAWPDKVLPWTRMGVELSTHNLGSLGCHMGQLAQLKAPTNYPDNREWLKDYVPTAWGEMTIEARTAATKAMLELPDLKEKLFNHIATAFGLKAGVFQFYIATDNLDYNLRNDYSYSDQWFATRDFIEYLVDSVGWGVVSSHIGRNHNYTTPTHNVQVWILTPPSRLQYLHPNTRFSANVDKDKIGKPENLMKWNKNQVIDSSLFAYKKPFAFHNYIMPKIKRLKNFRELFTISDV